MIDAKEFKDIACKNLTDLLNKSIKNYDNSIEENTFRMCLKFAKQYIEELYNNLELEKENNND